MRKVGIIGLGHVGVTVAYTLITKGIVDELVCIDIDEKKAKAEFYDFSDALAILPNQPHIIMNSYEALADADIIITAFGDIRLSVEGNDRFGELSLNAKNAKEVGQKLKAIQFDGILLNISNPCDVICALLQHYTGLPKGRVLGTGTSLDTARMKRALAQHYNVASNNISGYVLGEHGDSQFIAWSTVQVNHLPFSISKAETKELEEKTRNGAWTIVEGKGYTSYGIASCAVEIVNAIFNDAHQLLIVSTPFNEEETYIGYPAIIGAKGIVDMIELPLSQKEKEALAKTAQMIQEKIDHSL